MFIAIDENNNKVHAFSADKTHKYYCPVCREEVTPRQGDINEWHFAHKTECTDSWNYDMSEWHQQMQSMFPTEVQECVVKHNGETHRADILVDDVVIEFQHSPISVNEFCDRNDFYRSAGYRLAWVFDMRDAELEYKDSEGSGNHVRYKFPKRFLAAAPAIGDNVRDFAIWFCVEDEDGMYFEKVVWNTPDWTRLVFNSRCLDANAEAFRFVETQNEYIQSHLDGYKYKIKRNSQRGFPRDSYVCPRRPTEFGIDLYGEMGCLYCKHCGIIVDKAKGSDVYCVFPEQFNEPIDNALPGYEYSATRI